MSFKPMIYKMQVVCAWCGKHLYVGRCIEPGKISHGICEGCKKDMITQFESDNKVMEIVNKCY